MRHRRPSIVVAAVAAAALVLAMNGSATSEPQARASAEYVVSGVRTHDALNAVAATGAAINSVEEHGLLNVTATPDEIQRIQQLGLTVERQEGLPRTKDATPRDFPSADSNYHNYAEMTAAIDQAVAAHPTILSKTSIGSSHEGRQMVALKISDNVGTDEDEPEVLFTCNMHAREHLTTEMCLHIIQRFTDGYATDANIKNLVDNREIYVVPSQNPDGAEFDISGGEYQGWRKNRQPNSGGGVGTDINRNFSYKWGCCGGSSSSPGAEDYRGPSAASAPEVQDVQAFVSSRVVGGVQQIKGHIDFHTFSELVLWPFGHTDETVTEGMTQEEYDRFKSIGEEMAGSNGYTPEQSSGLYITDGDINDYMWGTHKVLSYCFEMYPTDGGIDGFYPPDEDIAPQTTRNDGAVDILLTNAT